MSWLWDWPSATAIPSKSTSSWKKLNLLLPDEEIAARLKALPKRPAPIDPGFLGLYCRHAAQADKGAILED